MCGNSRRRLSWCSRGRRQPHAVVGGMVAVIAQDEHDLLFHVDRQTAEHRSGGRRRSDSSASSTNSCGTRARGLPRRNASAASASSRGTSAAAAACPGAPRRQSGRSPAPARCPRSAASARRGSCRHGRRTMRETAVGRRRSAAALPHISPRRCSPAARHHSRARPHRATLARCARAAGGSGRSRDRSARRRTGAASRSVTNTSAARSPAFGVITSTPPAITGSLGSGGLLNRRA